jgi:hypothetical protein
VTAEAHLVAIYEAGFHHGAEYSVEVFLEVFQPPVGLPTAIDFLAVGIDKPTPPCTVS